MARSAGLTLAKVGHLGAYASVAVSHYTLVKEPIQIQFNLTNCGCRTNDEGVLYEKLKNCYNNR